MSLNLLRSLIFVFFASAVCLGAEAMNWPTPYPIDSQSVQDLDWAQPTISGRPTSATFGCVRNGGNRFHEGIDVQPYEARKNGEATDAVSAAWGGRVVYINKRSGTSSYGRYVIIEHEQFAPSVVTLYAHMATIDRGLKAGSEVVAGDRIGKMGRSAGGYIIPKSRAHLHFEIGLRLSDGFQNWYDVREFGNENDHGVWNGMNLVGLDPWAAWHWLKENPSNDIGDYARTLAPGFVLQLVATDTPDIVRRYPALLTATVPAKGLTGWRITFTGWGFPLAFTPLSETSAKREGTATIVAINSSELDQWGCRGLVQKQSGLVSLTDRGSALIELLFTRDER